MTREYTARETKWVVEYVNAFYPEIANTGKVVYQMPLGRDARGSTKRLAPRADAVIFHHDSIVLIEAEIENVSSAIGQLLFYDFIFQQTPDLELNADLPRHLTLLLSTSDGALELFAAKHRVNIDTWAPGWLEQYINEKRDLN